MVKVSRCLMMYQEKFVTAVRVAGKILRESGEQVFVPFGSEYSLLLKNKNSVRALVSVEIDGVDATGGTQLIVPANGSIDFERFIKDGNFDQGLKFKFIERTKKIEDGPRGIGAEDGLIRIQFEFEQQKAAYVPGPVYGPPIYRSYPYQYPGSFYGSLSDTGGATLSSTASMSGTMRSMSKGLSATSGDAEGVTAQNAAFVNNATMDSAPINDVGITVGGSVSDQKFVTAGVPAQAASAPTIPLETPRNWTSIKDGLERQQQRLIR